MSISSIYSCVFKVRYKQLFQVLICIAVITASQISIADSNLPDIGGPADADFSPGKEIELGKILIAEIRRQLPIINDPELSQYIHSLGTRITSGGLNSDFPFTFGEHRRHSGRRRADPCRTREHLRRCRSPPE